MNAARRFVHIDTARVLLRGRELIVLVIIAASFMCGALAGAFTGSADVPLGDNVLTGDGSIYGSDTYAGLLFSCARYHLLVLLFSTSLLGVFLIPATLAFRGFALACSAAYLSQAYPETGAVLAVAVLGLPALFTVPGLFVTAHWGELFSARLLALFTHRAPLPPQRRGKGNSALAVALLLFAAAAVEYYIVPQLVGLLI